MSFYEKINVSKYNENIFVWKFPRFREKEGEREREGGLCTDTHYKTRSNKREDIGMDKYGEKNKYRKE